MKTLLYQQFLPSIYALLFSIGLYAQTPPLKEKHALIIAIGEYAPNTGWASISSMNDVGFIKKTLLDQSFPEMNIATISNEKATRSGIVDAIALLTDRVKRGDVVVIHVSSHGSQIQDNNGDEADGLDESIVPYDALSRVVSTNYEEDQKKYLRDDEFGKLILMLRQKLGREGDILVMMDNCHSGTGSRGTSKVRGDKEPFVSAGFKAKQGIEKRNDGVFNDGASSTSTVGNLASYVVISAARSGELNYETKDEDQTPVGSLTYAFSKVLRNLDANTSYRNMFSKILVIMNEKVPNQKPVIEGSGLDRTLFGGAYNIQKPYLEISQVISDTVLRIQGGKLAGMDRGAKVDIYPSGTSNTSKAVKVTQGIVTTADMYTSDLRISIPVKDSQALNYWGFVSETVFNIKPISFNVITPKSKFVSSPTGQIFSDEESEKIKSSLNGSKFISVTPDNPELVLRKGKEKDDLVITANGYVYESFIRSGDYTKDLLESLRKYAQLQVILKDISSPDYKLDVKLIPVVKGKADSTLLASKYKKNGLEFRAGDTVQVWVKNNSNFNVYINILDIQPNGVINPIFPNSGLGMTPEECLVPSGTSILFPYQIMMTPPYGIEVFKVFASQDEINMEVIANSRGTSSRGNLNSFESLVRDSYTTRAEFVTQKSDGMVMSLPVVIVK